MAPPTKRTTPDPEPEIAAIRAARHRISAQFGHDPHRLVAYYQELQKALPNPVILAEKSPPEP